jgi:hypothetical protein
MGPISQLWWCSSLSIICVTGMLGSESDSRWSNQMACQGVRSGEYSLQLQDELRTDDSNRRWHHYPGLNEQNETQGQCSGPWFSWLKSGQYMIELGSEIISLDLLRCMGNDSNWRGYLSGPGFGKYSFMIHMIQFRPLHGPTQTLMTQI